MAVKKMDKTPDKAETGKALTTGSSVKGLILNDSGALPTYAPEDIGRGLENAASEDMETPRLKLIQATSKELQVYNELSAGDFLHVASEQIISGPTLVTPIFFDRRYLLWNPLDSGGGILARADDGVHWQPPNVEFDVKLDKADGGHKVKWKTADTVQKSGLNQWGTMNPADPNSAPAATLMLNFLLAFPEHPDWMPAVLTFQRSSIRPGRKFVTRLKTLRAPMFGTVFELSSFLDHNSAGKDFHNLQLISKGMIDPASELYQNYKEMNKQFTEMGLKVKDIEGLQDEGVGGNDTGDGEGADEGDGKAPKY